MLRWDNGVRIPSIVLAVLGIIDSSYLTWIKLSHNEAQCIRGVGDCFTVNTSPYASFHGIPVAMIGLGGYLLILAVLLLQSRGGFWEENGKPAVFGLTLFGTLFSAYLTYLEIAVIRAICPFCVVSAIIMLLLFALSIIGLNAYSLQSSNSKAGG